MTRDGLPGALRPEILASRIYTALVTQDDAGPAADWLAGYACDLAAIFLREWRRRDPQTAEPNDDDADLRVVDR